MRQISFRLSAEGVETLKAQLQALGREGQAALKQLETATNTQGLTGLRALDGAVNSARGALEGVAREASAAAGPLSGVTSSLGALGPAGAIAATALAAVTGALALGVKEVSETQVQMGRFEAQIRATGGAVGLTARELADFADEMAASSLQTSDAVKQAETALLPFRRIAGDTFKEVIRLAADMSEVTGEQLPSAAVKLAKALEDPAKGMRVLREVGVYLNKEQIELAQRLRDAGDEAGSQRVSLDELQKTIGGTGAGAAGGITGGIHKLGENLKNLAETFAASTGAAKLWGDTIAWAVDLTSRKLAAGDPAERIKAIEAELADRAQGGLFSSLRDKAMSGSRALNKLNPFLGPAIAGADAQNLLYKPTAQLQTELKSLEAAREREGIEKRIAQVKSAVAQSGLELEDAMAKSAAARKTAEEKAQKAAERAGEDRKRLAKAAADEAARQAKAQADRETALTQSIEHMELEARLATATKVEREETLALERARLQVGRDLTADEQMRISNAIRYKAAVASIESDGQELDRLLAASAQKRAELVTEPYLEAMRGVQRALADGLYDMFSDIDGGALDLAKSIKRTFLRLAAELASINLYKALFSSKGEGGGAAADLLKPALGTAKKDDSEASGFLKGFKDQFKEAGDFLKPITSGLKDAFTPVFDGLNKMLGGGLGGGLGGSMSEMLGKAGGGAAVGSLTAGVGNMLGLKMSQTGAQIGGAIGSFIPIPGGNIIGSLIGGTIGSLFKKTAKSSAGIVIGADGTASAGSAYSRGKGDPDAAASLADAVADQLNEIAKALGKQLDSSVKLGRVGMRKDEFVFETPNSLANKEFGANQYSKRFKSAEDAVAAALSDALGRGVVAGLSEASQRILKESKDLDAALDKVLKIETIGKTVDDALMQIKDPMAYELKLLDEQQKERIEIARLAGIDMAKVEELNGLERQKIIEQYSDQSIGAIKQMLSEMSSGSVASAYLGKDTVYQNAAARFAELEMKARGGDQTALAAIAGSAQEYLSASRGVNASSDAFYSDFSRVQSVLRSLSDAGPVVPIPSAGAGTASIAPAMEALGQTTARGSASIVTAITDLKSAVQDGAASQQALAANMQRLLAQINPALMRGLIAR